MNAVAKLVVLAAAFSMGTVVHAQSPNQVGGPCPAELESYFKSPDTLRAQLYVFLSFHTRLDCMASLLLTQYSTQAVLVDRAQQVKAAFQQNGSSAGGGGTTNAVSKGTAASILAFAAEHGAMTETVNNQAITLSGTIGGIPAALVQEGAVGNCDGIPMAGTPCLSSKTINLLNRLSYSVSFNASSSSQSVSGTATATSGGSTTTAQQVIFTASSDDITSATGKFVLLRGASATVANTIDAINKLQPGKSASIQLPTSLKSAINALDDHDTDAKVIAWRDAAVNALAAASPNQAASVWLAHGAGLINALCPNATDMSCAQSLLKTLSDYALFVNGYKLGVNAFNESLRSAPVVTAEYDWNHPPSQQTNSTFRLIAQTTHGGFTFTFNGAASIYNGQPPTMVPGVKRLRDAQAASEASFDFSKLKKSKLLGNSTASVAYYFQDQASPATLNVTPGQPVIGVTFTGLAANATQVYSQAGDIHLAQAKFTYAPGFASFSIPIAVTWSNRTELVVNPNWRGQVGISYDFDSLLGLLK